MRLKVTSACTAVVGMLALSALALAAHPRAGTFTSAKADIHVASGGTRITGADINCKLRGGVTIEAIDFNSPIAIVRSGAFSYSGAASYVTFTGNGYRSRMTTASVSGRFTSSKHATGKVAAGPSACKSVRFAASYNPRAH